jgi:hypothetical protein
MKYLKRGDQLPDGRYVAGIMNYKGDRTATFNMMKSYGPNTLGEVCWPVSITYNPITNLTTVAFTVQEPS